MIYLLMVPAMAAAIWAWRMAEANLERYKCEAETERTKSAKWSELYGRKCKELVECARVYSELKQEHDRICTELEQTTQQKNEFAEHFKKDCKHRTELMEEIDGLNIDKLALKERLQKYEAAEQKRREQKRVGMQRYRANKKTKNKTT